MNSRITNTIGFVESFSNDGSVKGDVIYALPYGERFSSGLSGEDLNFYLGREVVKGVPAGMTARLIVNKDLTSATLKLEGCAIDHAQADSTEITISFSNLATYFESQKVPADWSCMVFFNDTSSITIVNSLRESVLNDGSVEGRIVFKLNQTEFNADIDVTALVDSVPAGLIPELAISEDGKTATLTFSGKSVAHNVDQKINVAFTAEDFVDGNAPVEGLDETGTQSYIDFIAPKLVLSDEFAQDGLNFDQGWEGSDNKEISTILTLEDATFIGSSLDLTKFISNVPVGTTVSLKTISATEAALTLIAGDGVAFDPSEIQINLPREVFSNRVDVAARNIKIQLTGYDMTPPVVSFIKIDSGNNDTIITSQEREKDLTISGISEPGSTITLMFGTKTLSDTKPVDVFSVAIVDANSNGEWSYILKNADMITGNGSQLIQALAIDAAGNSSEPATIELNFVTSNHSPTGRINVKGIAKVGQTLSVANNLKDADGLGEFSYQWFSNKNEIVDATSATYTLSKFDAGKKISVAISYTDGEGTLESVTSSTTATIKPANNGAIKIGDEKDNKLQGATKNDDLEGLAGDDVLIGKAGNDTLNGGDGKDSLTGDAGFDMLIGGKGSDVFIFTNIKDAPVSRSGIDVITDFNAKEGDKIDLSKMDADATKSKDQTFSKPTVGEKFSGKFANIGDLFFETSTEILYGNVNKDGAADFAIQLSGVKSLSASDLIL